MSERKYHRYVFQYEVLSEEPLDDSLSLRALHHLTYDGPCSGQFLETTHEEVDGKTMAELLLKQGSDPGFFQLDEPRPRWEPDSGWDDHPKYSRPDWQYEVSNGDTCLGYVEWVNNQMEMAQEEDKDDVS
jgi:hypothetical protein